VALTAQQQQLRNKVTLLLLMLPMLSSDDHFTRVMSQTSAKSAEGQLPPAGSDPWARMVGCCHSQDCCLAAHYWKGSCHLLTIFTTCMCNKH
jgi:hypothetical protein